MKRDILIIFIFALVLRLFVAWHMGDMTPYSDMAEYNALAFGDNTVGLASERTWGYPLCLSVIYLLFGRDNFLAVYVIQAIVGAISCVLIYYIASKIATRRAALTAALIAAIDPHLIGYTGTLLTETLAIFLVLAAVVVLFMEIGAVERATILALVLSFAIWVKPACALFVPGFLFLIEKKWRFLWIVVPLCLVFVCGSKLGAINFYLSYNEIATGKFIPIESTPLMSYDHTSWEFLLTALSNIAHHPWGMLLVVCEKVYMLFGYGADAYALRPIFDGNYLLGRYFVFFYPFMALFGFIGLIRHFDKRIALPFLSYVILIIMFSIFGYRFRVMFEPCLIVFVGVLIGGRKCSAQTSYMPSF